MQATVLVCLPAGINNKSTHHSTFATAVLPLLLPPATILRCLAIPTMTQRESMRVVLCAVRDSSITVE